jgi:hypothetical protein
VAIDGRDDADVVRGEELTTTTTTTTTTTMLR